MIALQIPDETVVRNAIRPFWREGVKSAETQATGLSSNSWCLPSSGDSDQQDQSYPGRRPFAWGRLGGLVQGRSCRLQADCRESESMLGEDFAEHV